MNYLTGKYEIRIHFFQLLSLPAPETLTGGDLLLSQDMKNRN